MRLRTAVAITIASATSLALFSAPVSAGNGATQVAGQTDSAVCDAPPAGFEGSQDPSTGYAFHISGDLTGCMYGVITDARFHPSGTYQEVADEIFVSDVDSGDTFQMVERYTAKFDTADFSLFFARCKHPIVSGSGAGAFEGVSGRLAFKDDVETILEAVC